MHTLKNNMHTYYQKREELAQKTLIELKQKNDRVANYRLLAIILTSILFYFGISYANMWIMIPLMAGIIIGFYFLVKYHERVSEQLFQKENLLKVLKNELGILRFKPNSYDSGEAFKIAGHRYADDLDVFGEFSLFSKVNRAKTERGKKYLANSFLSMPTSQRISQRQLAIEELKAKNEWREDFLATLIDLETKESVENLVDIPEPDKLKGEWLLKLYPYLSWMLLVGVAASFYWLGLEAGVISVFAILGLHMSLVGLNKKITEPVFLKVKGYSRALSKYRLALNHIISASWQSEELTAALAVLNLSNKSYKNPIDSFEFIARRIDMKNNQFASFFLYFYSPFDMIELLKLRKWLQQNPAFFEKVFHVIGLYEELTSFATLGFNNPDWVKPVFVEAEEVIFDTTEAFHPLIADAVSNSFNWTSDNRLSLITGSNMSGKSTFLRTLGTNLLLAYAGSTVAAKKFVTTAEISLFTYMRIKDSLQQNASTFKAEIDRIKMLLDALKKGTKTILLVDEMLRGTNSEDKLKGSMAFLEEICHSKAYAAVATHDLRMTEISEIHQEMVKNYFFEYNSEGGNLTFDYKIKPGICSSFNASELLRNIGLNI